MNDFFGLSSSYLDEYILQGGLTMLALVPLSIYTLALVIQRFWELRRSHVLSDSVITSIQNHIRSGNDLTLLKEYLESESSPLAEVALGYICAGERGETLEVEVNPAPLDDVMDKIYQCLSPLSTAYVIAPLIGVLGTTIGIMGTFEQFAIVGKRDMSALVSAIDKSLITTMWGLIIAVPAYLFYAMLQNRVFHYERYEFPKVLKRILPNLRKMILSKPESKLQSFHNNPDR